MRLYQILLLIHVLSAILGLGPGFIMIYVVTRAKTLTELRYAYLIRNRLHVFVMVGGVILPLSGLLMGWVNPYLFKMGWYVTSLILYILALVIGPLILSPRTKPIRKLLESSTGDDIPVGYYPLAKELFKYERLTNLIFVVIIILMVLKPF